MPDDPTLTAEEIAELKAEVATSDQAVFRCGYWPTPQVNRRKFRALLAAAERAEQAEVVRLDDETFRHAATVLADTAAAERAQQAKAELEGNPEEPDQPRARLRAFDRIPAERKAQLRAIGDLDTALTNALEIDPAGARRMIERHLERAATRSEEPDHS